MISLMGGTISTGSGDVDVLKETPCWKRKRERLEAISIRLEAIASREREIEREQERLQRAMLLSGSEYSQPMSALQPQANQMLQMPGALSGCHREELFDARRNP